MGQLTFRFGLQEVGHASFVSRAAYPVGEIIVFAWRAKVKEFCGFLIFCRRKIYPALARGRA
jgi:hypothetical protein